MSWECKSSPGERPRLATRIFFTEENRDLKRNRTVRCSESEKVGGPWVEESLSSKQEKNEYLVQKRLSHQRANIISWGWGGGCWSSVVAILVGWLGQEVNMVLIQERVERRKMEQGMFGWDTNQLQANTDTKVKVCTLLGDGLRWLLWGSDCCTSMKPWIWFPVFIKIQGSQHASVMMEKQACVSSGAQGSLDSQSGQNSEFQVHCESQSQILR